MANLKARIEILNWREHGDDESFVAHAVYGEGQESDLQKRLMEEHEITDAVKFYVNDDITIEDGQVLTSGGRKFRLNITEVV